MHGDLAPGQALTLRGIGKEYEVSMTPAREAVRRLAAEGALTMSASGRISTPELSNERIEELAALRALIEVELASRALPRAHLALIDRMQAINNAISDAVIHRDAVSYIRTNLEFHRTLYLRAQAPAMLAMGRCWTYGEIGELVRRAARGLQDAGLKPGDRFGLCLPNCPYFVVLYFAALRAGDEPGLRLAVRTDVTQGLRMLAT